jgi:hypothetical protein
MDGDIVETRLPRWRIWRLGVLCAANLEHEMPAACVGERLPSSAIGMDTDRRSPHDSGLGHHVCREIGRGRELEVAGGR